MDSPGEVMRRIRLARDLDVASVAELTGLEARRIQDLEAGVGHLWFSEGIALARAYGLSIDELASEAYARKLARRTPSISKETP